MLDISRVQGIIKSHFAIASDDDMKERIERYCGQTNEGANEMVDQSSSQLALFKPGESPLPLEAYLACALSGLEADQRELMFQLSDAVALCCKNHQIDLYEPRKNTDPVHHREIKDSDVFTTDRQRVLSSDLLIHLSHFPSTGSGEELDFASSALLPMIIISREGAYVSRMITGIPSFKLHIRYSEPEELRAKLEDTLIQIRPLLEERKLSFSEYDRNIVGERVRILREQLSLTRKEVSESVPGLTEDALKQIEESSDRLSNPSLLQLRQLATVLKTTVADLIEPNTSGIVLSILQDWMSGQQAARYPGISVKERNKLLRRILLRIIDSLEHD